MDHRIAALGLVVAQHYRLLRNKVLESKQKGSVQFLTNEEAALADYLADTIEGLAGKAIGNYCRSQFQRGWMTLDLRAYKIKFVLTKLRDLLPKGRAKDELIANLDFYVAPAEHLAGCQADNKRRNKAARAEQAKLVRQHKEERALLKAQGRKAARNTGRIKPSNQMEFDSLLAEVDSSASPQEEKVDEKVEEKVTEIPVTEKSVRLKSKKNDKKTHKIKKKASLEQLADEITAKEYGEEEPEEEEDPNHEDEEDYGKEDREYLRDNLCNHYARTFSGVCRYGDADRATCLGGDYDYDPNND